MCDDKLDALVAELQAIELWDRAGEKLKPAPEGEIEARRLRRVEIIREIDTMLERQIEALRYCSRKLPLGFAVTIWLDRRIVLEYQAIVAEN